MRDTLNRNHREKTYHNAQVNQKITCNKVDGDEIIRRKVIDRPSRKPEAPSRRCHRQSKKACLIQYGPRGRLAGVPLALFSALFTHKMVDGYVNIIVTSSCLLAGVSLRGADESPSR